jgi:hypothetical protein
VEKLDVIYALLPAKNLSQGLSLVVVTGYTNVCLSTLITKVIV